MDYEYEIFLSYRRSDTVGPWVKTHLEPRLSARLNEIAPGQIRISCDFQMESGARWPDELKRRLRLSGLLLTVWSADYFRSAWCMAEWRSFKEREQMLGLFGAQQTKGLVYPIRYADGDYFHPEAKITQWNKDFSRYNYPDEVFRQSAKYIDFDDLVKEMAQELVAQLQTLPQWRADFPIVEPAPLPPPSLKRTVL
jgi:hypothetical protein